MLGSIKLYKNTFQKTMGFYANLSNKIHWKQNFQIGENEGKMNCRNKMKAFFSSGGQMKFSEKRIMELLFRKLQQEVNYGKELEDFLTKQDAIIDYSKEVLSKEDARHRLTKLTPLIQHFHQISSIFQNIQDLQEMLKETTLTKEDRSILEKDLKELELKKLETKDQCASLLIPTDVFDDSSEITMELRPGAGGQESSIFVEDISDMYLSFCSSKGWRTSIISCQKQSGTTRGFKYINFKVVGQNVHHIMKCESGVHKVIRIPETESKGRLHSSTISVVVMPVVPFNFVLNPKDIKYQYTKSSGPGGQAVNKIQSACRAIHIPTGLQVFIQEERSQDQNRKRATQILKQRLFEIEYQKAVESESQTRKSQVTTLDRSEKIRTYNYPQDRITDHRTGFTLFGIKAMMQGTYLNQFIDEYRNKIYEEKLKALLMDLSKSETVGI